MTSSDPTTNEPLAALLTNDREASILIAPAWWHEPWQRLRRHRSAMAGLFLLLLIVTAAILAPWLAPYPVDEPHLDFIREAPSHQFWLGTDSLGRDIFSRLLHGARIALLIAAVIVTIEVSVGVPLGVVAGYFGGKLDLVLNMVTDVVWAFPPLVLALGVVAALGSGMINAVIAIALVSWVPFARITRAKVMSLRRREFVQASVALGSGHIRILQHHVLPHVIATNLVLVTLTLPAALLTAAALSFLGFGIQPPTPEWGAMLSEGRLYLQDAPWMSTFPGLAILITVIGFNLLGEGIRDILDPQQRASV